MLLAKSLCWWHDMLWLLFQTTVTNIDGSYWSLTWKAILKIFISDYWLHVPIHGFFQNWWNSRRFSDQLQNGWSSSETGYVQISLVLNQTAVFAAWIENGKTQFSKNNDLSGRKRKDGTHELEKWKKNMENLWAIKLVMKWLFALKNAPTRPVHVNKT